MKAMKIEIPGVIGGHLMSQMDNYVDGVQDEINQNM